MKGQWALYVPCVCFLLPGRHLTVCAMARPPRGKGMDTGLVRVRLTPLVSMVGSSTSIWFKSDQRDSTLSPLLQRLGRRLFLLQQLELPENGVHAEETREWRRWKDSFLMPSESSHARSVCS